MSSSEIVTSAGIIGTYVDPVNDRFRGMAPEFVDSADGVLKQWEIFAAEANAQPNPATRLTLRVVTSPEAATNTIGILPAEAFVPLSDNAGLLYLAQNHPGRRAQLPIEHMHAMVDTVAADIQGRFRSPASRLAELHQLGYRFVNHVIDRESLLALWGPTFGWEEPAIDTLERRLADNAKCLPADRDLWFTGVVLNDRFVGAVLGERLDVPGPDDSIPTIESTEWAVDKTTSHPGVAAGMLALSTAQCLVDIPDARILAECRFSSTAYASGMSIGLTPPDRTFGQQVLERNVWVDGELADFVPMVLSDGAIQEHYSPQQLYTLLNYVNR